MLPSSFALRPILPAICATLLALPAWADDLPPGLASARLLPGWTDEAGRRVLALELDLEPGWKTYWRSPGDSGLPPDFDWTRSANLARVHLHWPAPDAIDSGDAREMGYRDRLVLPLTAEAADPADPMRIAVDIDLGLCENICVPAHLTLDAPAPGAAPDPAILTALKAEPKRLDALPRCDVTPIADGVRVAMHPPVKGVELAAIELTGRPEIWVSGADLNDTPDGPEAVVEMVGPTAAPFDLDRSRLRLTMVTADGAVETQGCAAD
ncbi:protein-disulfide reductase DsbD domain-containing protein [Paracoccus zeaxanthinifaciens]|uniref:protein-disulfide reductase DsbD domain-containing protein n=1 Tax=Paracoccus zeaxanthinifaciens TaxID=187400 RepID=UPI0003B40576|nr:protein-disulfide reductase DsbD domain-containing protein [Paracoccus zeaxanthinifaciens]